VSTVGESGPNVCGWPPIVAVSGATVGFLFARLRVDETIHTSLGLLSLYLLATALFAWGPFYALFRYSTRKPTDAQSTVKKVD